MQLNIWNTTLYGKIIDCPWVIHSVYVNLKTLQIQYDYDMIIKVIIKGCL